MSHWSRRELLKLGALAPATARAFAAGPSPAPAGWGNAGSAGDARPSPRERLRLDFDWRFHFGNASDPAKDFGFGGGDGGAFAKTGEIFEPSRRDFDDSGWQQITLPHDFLVGLPFVEDADLYQYGFKPVGREYPETSIGWYRRVFEIPRADLGRRLALEFDGVFRDAMVVLNGIYLGRNLSGYAPFGFDITDSVRYGEQNILVVRADATEHEGWFYEGAGIYRHVWLAKTDALHVGQWGTYVRSETNGNDAQVSIFTEVLNASGSRERVHGLHLTQAIFDSAGKQVAASTPYALSVPPWATQEVSQTLQVRNPSLWSVENPHLYRLVSTIAGAEVVVDRYETRFGIRTMRFDPDHGFFLNGERVEIKGVCNHQDHAAVGSALPDRLQYFRIAKLKEMGANAYRTSHNPPTPELLDACDRLGMLVMDETRMMSSSPEGLSQLERMVRRDRNHPCIFLWSLGNEEPEQGTPGGARICETMKRRVHQLDDTRPVTLAMNGSWGQGASTVVDVQGCNYFHLGDMDRFHAAFPEKPIIGSEDASALSTRGVYANDAVRGYLSAYDVNRPAWGSLAEDWWNFYAARRFAAGAFAWTGFDYRGEPTPYKWPCISSHFGIMDTCGFAKDTYFYYQAWWTGKTVLHLFPHWSWPGRDGEPIRVWVHSNCDQVELFLNGRSLGRKAIVPRKHLEWQVNYVPGILLARGYKNGLSAEQVAEDQRETTGAPALVKLTPDRASIAADAQDVSVITVSVLDRENRLVPIADNEITFEISGVGKIIGVGNGDPSSHEPDQATQRKVFNGLAQVIVQSESEPGTIRLSAHSPGLASASIALLSASPHPAA